ncbi:hypothetical protein Hanom_Chr09g00793121 [Helianthus anomalus]
MITITTVASTVGRHRYQDPLPSLDHHPFTPIDQNSGCVPASCGRYGGVRAITRQPPPKTLSPLL